MSEDSKRGVLITLLVALVIALAWWVTDNTTAPMDNPAVEESAPPPDAVPVPDQEPAPPLPEQAPEPDSGQ